MTRAEMILMKPIKILKEMKSSQNKRDAIAAKLALHGINYSNTRVQVSTFDRFADAAAEIDEIGRDLLRLDREYIRAINAASAFIDTLADDMLCTVLYMFYLGGKSPAEIGEQLGYGVASIYRFKRRAIETLNDGLNQSLSATGENIMRYQQIKSGSGM